MVGREPSERGKMVSRLSWSTAKCMARMSTRLLAMKRMEQWFWLAALECVRNKGDVHVWEEGGYARMRVCMYMVKNDCILTPGWKGTRLHAFNWRKYAFFT